MREATTGREAANEQRLTARFVVMDLSLHDLTARATRHILRTPGPRSAVLTMHPSKSSRACLQAGHAGSLEADAPTRISYRRRPAATTPALPDSAVTEFVWTTTFDLKTLTISRRDRHGARARTYARREGNQQDAASPARHAA